MNWQCFLGWAILLIIFVGGEIGILYFFDCDWKWFWLAHGCLVVAFGIIFLCGSAIILIMNNTGA